MTDFSRPTTDDEWLAQDWPLAVDAVCQCYDPASMEYAPTMCMACRREAERDKENAA